MAPAVAAKHIQGAHDGQAHHGEVVPLDRIHQRRPETLNPVRPRLVHGLPGGDVLLALAQVERLFGAEDEIEVARSENHLGFRKNGTQVFTRLIEGPYPNYEQVIPRDNDKNAIADKNQLTQALRRMAVVASDQTHRVRLSFNTNTLRFSVETPDLGEATEELEIEYGGEALDIGFNASYLLEVLRYMPSEDVKLTMKAPERAATIEPVSRDGDDAADYLCLVMPLRLLE